MPCEVLIESPSLESTDLSVDDIAGRVGFAGGSRWKLYASAMPPSAIRSMPVQ
jgi:transcriptional regulator GlxA family with amidase domain